MGLFVGLLATALVQSSSTTTSMIVAIVASGALTLEQAVLLIFHRSRVQFKATDKGRMLAVGASREEAEKLITGKEDKVSIGAVNGPEMVALSGDTDIIESIAEELNKKDIFHRLLAVNVPFHTKTVTTPSFSLYRRVLSSRGTM